MDVGAVLTEVHTPYTGIIMVNASDCGICMQYNIDPLEDVMCFSKRFNITLCQYKVAQNLFYSYCVKIRCQKFPFVAYFCLQNCLFIGAVRVVTSPLTGNSESRKLVT